MTVQCSNTVYMQATQFYIRFYQDEQVLILKFILVILGTLCKSHFNCRYLNTMDFVFQSVNLLFITHNSLSNVKTLYCLYASNNCLHLNETYSPVLHA